MILSLSAFAGEDHPDVGPGVPRTAAIITEDGVDAEPGVFEPARHLAYRERPEGQREIVAAADAAARRDVALIEDGEAARAILGNRFDQRHRRRAPHPPRQRAPRVVL